MKSDYDVVRDILVIYGGTHSLAAFDRLAASRPARADRDRDRVLRVHPWAP